jgi:hypothetical protein
MVSVFAVIAFLIGIFGLLASSQASFGAAIVGFACLLAILARIAQADAQQEALIAAMTAARTAKVAPPASAPVAAPAKPAAATFGFTRDAPQ